MGAPEGGAYPGCIGHAGGTPCPTEVDALSYGRDKPIQPGSPIPPGSVLFSVDEFAKGIPGAPVSPNVTSEGATTINMEDGDILTTPLPPFLGGVSPFPGICIAAENLALATMRSGFPGPAGDELDALDFVGFPVGDCNGNGVSDALDIAVGISSDCNSNGLPDECEPDCNGNGVPDGCYIASGTSTDVNGDGVPDDCQLIATPYCFCDSTKPAPCLNFDATAGCRNSTGAGAGIT